MAEPFVGEIRIFAFNFTPEGWAPCDGRLLSIMTNQALYSLLGVRYGGDGRTTFGLPDLRGRVGIGQGQGRGLSYYQIAQTGGFESVPLTIPNLPSHNHQLMACSAEAGSDNPAGAALANARSAVYYVQWPNTPMIDGSVGMTGSGIAVENRQPFLCLNVCIALIGVYPSRP